MRTGVIRAIIAAGCLSRGVWKIFLIIVDSLDWEYRRRCGVVWWLSMIWDSIQSLNWIIERIEIVKLNTWIIISNELLKILLSRQQFNWIIVIWNRQNCYLYVTCTEYLLNCGDRFRNFHPLRDQQIQSSPLEDGPPNKIAIDVLLFSICYGLSTFVIAMVPIEIKMTTFNLGVQMIPLLRRVPPFGEVFSLSVCLSVWVHGPRGREEGGRVVDAVLFYFLLPYGTCTVPCTS